MGKVASLWMTDPELELKDTTICSVASEKNSGEEAVLALRRDHCDGARYGRSLHDILIADLYFDYIFLDTE